ncbi:MAG TPA: DMT family transporter, partial [Candidatus Nanopelagicales bacterium]
MTDDRRTAEPPEPHAHHAPGPPDAVTGVPVPPPDAPETPAPSQAGPAEAASGFHKRPALGYALYLTAALLFGINGTVSKVLLQAVDDAARVSQLRVTAAFLLLLVVVALTNPQGLRLRGAELGPVAAYGILGVAMTQWLYFVAITRMPIGIALLIEFTAP